MKRFILIIIVFFTVLMVMAGSSEKAPYRYHYATNPGASEIKAGDLFSTDNIIGNMRYVPSTGAGFFVQGSPGTEPGRLPTETQFNHKLTYGIAVMETEVTHQMWADLKTQQPTLPEDPTVTTDGNEANWPVRNIKWNEAILFANLLSNQNGLTPCYYTDNTKKIPIDATNYDGGSSGGNFYCDFAANGYRLPSEGEWEYAARAGTTSAFFVDEPGYNGTELCTPKKLAKLEAAAWFCANSSGTAKAVGQKNANPWKLKDIYGNAAEFCWDWSDNYPVGPETDYHGPATTKIQRVIRGGDYNNNPTGLRSAWRGSVSPLERIPRYGFRLVRTIGGGSTTPSITVKSPNGSEQWYERSVYTITWTSKGSIGNVKIEYSTDNRVTWETVTVGTLNTGKYSWTMPGENSTQCFVKVSDILDGNINDTSDNPFSILPFIAPKIEINRSHFNFTAILGGAVTGSQEFSIENKNAGNLTWTLSKDAGWLSCTPTSGTNGGIVTVSVNPAGLSEGNYLGTITVTDPDADPPTEIVTVFFKVKSPSESMAPFGVFETPIDGSTVRSSIPVTGWVLDDVGIDNVKIYRESIGGLVYIGDAVLVEGARPDVVEAYPNYPKNYEAGWGYMMLTNFLPNGGNGTFVLHAIVTDKEGKKVTLGTKTILCDNANAVKPFGAIDTPAQGGLADGNRFINWGWALTPLPNSIPQDGSTVTVFVDGNVVGKATYNVYRPDIAALFPGYTNSSGAAGYFYLDTTAYENGVHTISWYVIDNAGNSDGIGSRYFKIQNSTAGGQQSLANAKFSRPHEELSSIPTAWHQPIRVKKGFKQDNQTREIYPGDSGTIDIEIKELERLVIGFNDIHLETDPVILTRKDEPTMDYRGYMAVGSRLKPLPVGSTLDMNRGVFYWQPGPGFIGNYELVFTEKNQVGEMVKWIIMIKIMPKFH